MPTSVSTECVRQCRFNDYIWIDDQNMRSPQSRYQTEFGEHTANNLLTDLTFLQHIQPDALDCFVRRSFLPHADPSMAWNIIVSAKRTPLSTMPTEGLYEFKNGTRSPVSNHPYNGDNIGAVLSEPLWGPHGKYALMTSMEMNTYNQWIGPERQRNMKRDPAFKAFSDAMAALGEMPMYMDKEEIDNRTAHAMKCLSTVHNRDEPTEGLEL